MSHTLSIQQASTQLQELVRSLRPDDEIVLTDNDRPIARIVPNSMPQIRNAGGWKGKVEIVDKSDDWVQEQFAGYLP